MQSCIALPGTNTSHMQSSFSLLCSSADPRFASFGSRLLLNNTSDSDTPQHKKDEQEAQFDVYTRWRLLHGFAEGAAELSGAIPLEANLDLLHGISFSKGCYTGQELIARTKYKVAHSHNEFFL